MPPEGDTQEAPATVDTDKVTAALRDAAREDMAAEQAQQTPPAPPEPEASAPVDEGANNQEPPAEPSADDLESFMNIDPASLPPELQAQYRNMQSHFTRATQEAAPFRQLAEQYGVSAEEAAQALDFVGRLQSDPAYTQQVYAQLGEYLQQTGALPRQPQAAPGPEDNDAAFMDGFDPTGGSPTDTPSREVGSPLEARLQALEAQLRDAEQRAYMRDLAAQIKEAEFAVREAHPDWKDTDVQRVYSLAPTFNGDLVKAADEYEAMRRDIIGQWIDQKSQAPAGTPQSASTGTEAPTAPTSIREAGNRLEEQLLQTLGD